MRIAFELWPLSAKTCPGRARDHPGPVRGSRIASVTVGNRVQSSSPSAETPGADTRYASWVGRAGEAAAHETWTGQACTLRSLLCPTFAITRVILHAEETVRSAARPEEGGESMSAVKAAAVRSARRTILTSLAPA
ncbi:hypothetical protein Sgou_05620 [Streptomyces gougerotii]|uniref:Uncharacterized protein n=1 Tax=Streptomyces gougerotii TaxID=53448 RepID=A0A8H9LTW6_9ACTN|nr:hypothetical protein Sgou_05620 [Streptomyces gougerotii]GGU91566.1 hypothetical protein GCM10010227_53540 [Streptomyces gougerotii]